MLDCIENQLITEDILKTIGFKNICFDWWDYKFEHSPYTNLRYDFRTKDFFVNNERQRNKIFTIWELEMTLIFNRAWDDRIDFNKFLNKHNN